METKTITSNQSKTPVGRSGTELYTRTRLTYTLDQNGKIDTEKTKYEILYQQVPGDPPVVAATKVGETQNFIFNKNNFTGQTYFGADAQKSLTEGALKTATNQQINDISQKEGLTPQQRQDLSISPNSSTIQEDVIPIGTSTNVDLGIFQSDFLTNFGDVRYPKDIGNNGQDYIKFSLIEYGTRQFGTGVGALEKPLTARTEPTTTLGTVVLPIQPSINDQNGVNWGEENANAFQLVAAAAAKNPGSIPDMLQGGVDLITGNSAYKELLLKQLAGQAGGINPLARTDGLVVNPNLELLFNGPTLRPFTFVFRLSPRDDKETVDVKKIIRFFKEGSAVKTTKTGLFLKAPNVFKISYANVKVDEKTGATTTLLHPGLNQIKTCALRTVNVNYTPDGSYMTFRDGTMTSYEISLQFSELEPIYDKDYTASVPNNIENVNYIGY